MHTYLRSCPRRVEDEGQHELEVVRDEVVDRAVPLVHRERPLQHQPVGEAHPDQGVPEMKAS